MNKRIELDDLDIPKDDVECWERYPKHRWVYNLSQILDVQHVKWSPYPTRDLQYKIANMDLYSTDWLEMNPGSIYVQDIIDTDMWTELYLIKGDIKHTRHVDPQTGKDLQLNSGDIELRINAITKICFRDFTGVLKMSSCGNTFYRISLRPLPASDSNDETLRLKKRIYKKRELSITPTVALCV